MMRGMTTTRYVVLGRDAERIFAPTGWSRQMTDSPEFKTKAEAERFRDSLLVAWDRDDLKIERREHLASCTCGECEEMRDREERRRDIGDKWADDARRDRKAPMPSDEDVCVGADDDAEAAQ